MSLRYAFKKLEVRSQLGEQRLPAIAPDVQAAAFLWSVKRERCDYRMPPKRKSPFQQRYICRPICRVRKEVKYRTIVPHIEASQGGNGGYIGHDPMDHSGSRSKPVPSPIDRRFGNIEYGNRIAAVQKFAGKERSPAAYINHAASRTYFRDQGQGQTGICLGPA